jgi:MoCo/4Fe-4S cofactor protein with predicted Tat translocation signal
MKRIWHHPAEPANAKRYWRSPAELERRAEFLSKAGVEFPAGDTLTTEEQENSRREFMKLMGAATGLMGLGMASCRRPVFNILPYTDHVEWVIPGKPLLYATAMPRAGGATPLVVTTYEGRPTHLQGNTLHPIGGGIDAFAQASILDLYDPERSRTPMVEGKPAEWDRADAILKKVATEAAKDQGASLAVVVGDTTSPTILRLLGEIAKSHPQATLVRYEALATPYSERVHEQLFGAPVRPFVNFSRAKRILALDCDFLGLDPVAGEHVKEFSRQRSHDAPGGEMNRLYAVENRFTVTGGMADHRKPLAASLIPVAAAVIAAELGETSAQTLAAGAPKSLRDWLMPAIEDLKAHQGSALVLAGSRHGPEVHAMVAAINSALGAYGSTVALKQAPEGLKLGGIQDLRVAVEEGKVKSIVSLTPSNLLYDAPRAAVLVKAIKDKKIAFIHHGLSRNFSARRSALHLPAAHYLESWGDVTSADGTYSIVQPMIQPLHGGVSEVEVLLALLGRKSFSATQAGEEGEAEAAAPEASAGDPAYEAVRETFAAVAGGLNEEAWNFTLRDGFLKKDGTSSGAQPVANMSVVANILAKAKPVGAPEAGSMEVVLAPSANVWDGRYASNSWLQEMPDPITKLTWDNAAWFGSKTFRDLKLKEGQMVEISVGDRKITLPAIEAPGHVTHSITITLGYGQRGLGFVGSDSKGQGRGVNAYVLRRDASFVLTGAKVSPTKEIYPLAITQEHNTMEGRSLYREGTLDRFNDEPDFAQNTGMDSHIPENISFYKGQVGRKSEDNPAGFDYDLHHQWGMTIDLSKCMGCTACIIACQSENNIPVVGKDQVRKGRVMQWIRMDRYFAVAKWGEQEAPADDVMIDPTPEQLENAEMVMQPVACQQCESAPCETVCPVNATVHTEDGLNAMAYNRCIGTRYCANNCPYTARRFNWFDYNKRPLDELYWGPLSTPEKTGVRESLKLQKNPNVTVRMRGVIEKCTYCVQRLETAKNLQKQKQRDTKNFRVPTDSVKVACQQACPVEAIEFGDLADPASAIVKAKASPRSYELLKYIGTRPRTSYLARLRNPNPKMPGAGDIAVWSDKQI